MLYGAMTFKKYLTTCVFFSVFLAVTIPGKLPEAIYRLIFISQMFFFFSARGTQIMLNFKEKSTGSLSIITCFLNWAGNLARLFTLIVDIGFGDLQVLGTHAMFFMFNIVPFSQIIWYGGYLGNKVVKKEKKENKKKESEKESESEAEEEEEVVVRKRKVKHVEKKEAEQLSETTVEEEVVKRRKKTRKRED